MLTHSTGIDYKQVPYTEEIIFVKPTPTHTALTPTSTATTTSTANSTSTIVPADVTVNSSDSTTTTITANTATTATTTATVSTTITTTTTSTSYAACATNNLLGPQIQNGDCLYNSNFYDISNTLETAPGAITGLACCIACQTATNNCQFSLFASAQNTCFIVAGGSTCTPGQNPMTFVESSGPNAFDVVYAYGPCETISDAGPI